MKFVIAFCQEKKTQSQLIRSAHVRIYLLLNKTPKNKQLRNDHCLLMTFCK